ncbi:hypothetical protein N658DRAFT_423689 [Parathielavia hyrcaniae]|uniref:Survival Motor Neuron Gemin2-binding domain-containing protein n=1 Tax=Parathielavia hyrcaniae TaxID=113614 RepID=A0AAN6Q2Y1_9PEZI|nr:hypothetical protein N658DRAFT_423689 [Parathielavia hyrcaniae]
MDPDAAASHEEIWDDSALVESWNQALDEYKKYHSIHAKGGTVDDILNGPEAKTRSNAKPETGDAHQPIAMEAAAEQGEVGETIPMDESDETSHPAISDTKGSGAADKMQTSEVRAAQAAGTGPQLLLGTVQDEELKKLLMSWYYAGYYTGLYEGKQQGQQQAK